MCKTTNLPYRDIPWACTLQLRDPLFTPKFGHLFGDKHPLSLFNSKHVSDCKNDIKIQDNTTGVNVVCIMLVCMSMFDQGNISHRKK